ncbi:Phenylalanine--tRNA ligase alpha subunit [Labeo rohita]|uniref:Phenylalanine--tRNA ligase alpha subunit n=1 Tax=Labeo rohita TaxID=84645 RepID=A0ABQ8MVR7_LABRO|nr:Phenylalanine--tRNA ligase alpha subunit [Labeo rohita]
MGTNRAPASQPLEPPCVASGRDSADLTGLPQAVINTITQARAPSSRQGYALKWGLFADWCSSRREDPQRCSIVGAEAVPLHLKAYGVAIAAYHDAVDGLSLGKHHLIARFLRGARRLNPPRSHPIPSWDLSVVLLGLRRAPLEPLASVELKFCLDITPDHAHIYQEGGGPARLLGQQVPTTPLRDQVVSLQALPLEEADPALSLLCPVRALRTYVDRTRSFRRSEQLFVCLEGSRWGILSPSRGWLIGWLSHHPGLLVSGSSPLHRSVTSSHALAHDASLADICRAAGWATPNTLRVYNLRVEPVSSRVLGGSFTPPGCGLIFYKFPIFSLLFNLFHLTLSSVSAPPNACFSYLAPLVGPVSGLQGVGKRTTEGERLGYICNPRSLKEGTETLRPLATIRDCAGGLGFGSAPQLKSE